MASPPNSNFAIAWWIQRITLPIQREDDEEYWVIQISENHGEFVEKSSIEDLENWERNSHGCFNWVCLIQAAEAAQNLMTKRGKLQECNDSIRFQSCPAALPCSCSAGFFFLPH